MARSKKTDSIQVIDESTESINEVSIYDLTRNAYLNFGDYINNWRQLPQILDGLKISYRRLLYSALQYPAGKMVKSANLLGKMMECFTGDTEILDVNGNKFTIDSISNRLEDDISTYTFACDPEGNPEVTKILDVIDKGVVTRLVEITLDNGESFRCTPDHKIMLRTGIWIKAKDLKEESSLMPVYLKTKMCDNAIPRRLIKTNQYDRYARGKWSVVYHLSAKHYDSKEMMDTLESENDFYVIHHLDRNSLNDCPTNLVKMGNVYHRRLHGVEALGRYNISKGTSEERVKSVLSEYVDLECDETVLSAIYVRLKGDPLVRVYPDRSLIPKVAKNALRTLYAFIELMNLAINDGIKVLNEDLWDFYLKKVNHPTKHNIRYAMSSKYKDLLLSFGIDFEIEYSPKITVNKCPKFSSGQYPSKALKVLRSLKSTGDKLTPENFDKRFLELYKKRTINYEYVAVNLPELVSQKMFEMIGTKTVYKSNKKSLIYSDSLGNHRVSKIKFVDIPNGIRVYDLVVDSPYHNFTLGVGVIAHNCHPHSTEGSYNVVCSYVKTSVFQGQGFFGIRSIDGNSSPAAAPRYTEVRVSDNYRDILGRLIKKVPYVESPNGPLEPVYICTPLPMSLYCSDSSISGLGLGISTDLPNFSPKSLYEAYINDDPMLLEPGIDIGLDKSKSELHKLWNEGRGRVTYFYRTSRIKSPDGNPGMLIEGDAGIFIPRLKRIKDWQAEGKVYMEDMVTQDGAKLAIFKVPNIKSISIDDIEAEVNKVCVNNMTYNLNVSDGKSAFRIPLREWIKATYTNYINLVNSDNADQIADTMFDIEVYSNIEVVANYIINENPKADNDEICRATGVRPEVVSSIMTRTISTLRKTKDQTDKVKALKAKLKELKSFDAVKFTDEIVKKL